MANDIFRTAADGNAQLLHIMEELDVTPASSGIQGIDLTSHFVSFWDENYRLLRLNNSCFSRCLINHNLPDNQIFGLPVTDYFPDVDKDALESIHHHGGIYTVDNYRLAGHNLNTNIRIELTVSKVNNITVLCGEDLTDSLENVELLGKLEAEVDKLKKESANQNIALEVLLKRMQAKEREFRDAYSAQMQDAILPLLLSLEDSGLTYAQQEVVEEVRRQIMDIHNGREPSYLDVTNGDLTAREREIIGLIRAGKTTKEISQMICLSTKTIDSHRASIRRKLGLPSRGVSLYTYLTQQKGQTPTGDASL